MDPTHFDGWIPIRISWRQSPPVVEWCYLGPRRFSEPFFDHTIETHLRASPFALLFRRQTPVETLGELAELRPGLPPRGFIFHMSRCGSTLIARMLAALPQTIMLSEAVPIDNALRAHFRDPHLDEHRAIAWLRWTIAALSQPRRGDERGVFIKFDSWHTPLLPLIRRAYPDVPWAFVYRDPVEVLVSHRRVRGSQMFPGRIEPALLNIAPVAIGEITFDEYTARVLGSVCAAAAEHYDPRNGMLIEYRQLPALVWERLLNHFGVGIDTATLEQLREVSLFHAKTPQLFFTADATQKQYEAGMDLRQLAEQWIMPHYRQLEALRETETK